MKDFLQKNDPKGCLQSKFHQKNENYLSKFGKHCKKVSDVHVNQVQEWLSAEVSGEAQER